MWAPYEEISGSDGGGIFGGGRVGAGDPSDFRYRYGQRRGRCAGVGHAARAGEPIAPCAERARPWSPHLVPWLSQDQHRAYVADAIRREGKLHDGGAVRQRRPFQCDQSPRGAARRDRVRVYLRIQYFAWSLPFARDANPVAYELALRERV